MIVIVIVLSSIQMILWLVFCHVALHRGAATVVWSEKTFVRRLFDLSARV